jgi:hypothetical protein
MWERIPCGTWSARRKKGGYSFQLLLYNNTIYYYLNSFLLNILIRERRCNDKNDKNDKNDRK